MTISETGILTEYPERVELRKTLAENPLPALDPELLSSVALSNDDLPKHALAAIEGLNTALATDDVRVLEQCFFPSQSYWKDQFALTYNTRTFCSARTAAANLLATARLRGIPGGFQLQGDPNLLPVSPTLQWLDCYMSFKTSSPGAKASGRVLLLPHANDGTIEWKIWILSTWLDGLDIQPEDESLLKSPGRDLQEVQKIETDVVIIGGGNAGAGLAARLKALAVESVILERNANPGDSWALRYDSLRFHVPTSICDMPYMAYPKETYTPGRLSKDDLAAQLRRFIETFHLNTIHSAKIESTTFNPATKLWEVTFLTGPDTPPRVVVAKHLVQATGFSSQKPYMPSLPNSALYKGISLHSASYKNPSSSLPNISSVAIIGSANTAFDVLVDLADVQPPIDITIVVRSPTYIVPESYAFDPRGFGAYDFLPLAVADRNFNTLPTTVATAMVAGLFYLLASQEPDRYAKLAEVGFPVRDSTHPDENVAYNLNEKGGGHYVDIGGTKILEEGRAKVKNGEPVEWTERGLRFADGSEVVVDAVVWCTGYDDKNVKKVVEEVLGGKPEGETENGILGPKQIAERVDATGGMDIEGEVRGMWKRTLGMENYWVMGGHTAQHRWFSSFLALQIKAELEGILPPAYRDTL
ncbi:hypothetical protein B0T16DRAFT_421192 [Cercophora newfieldiana]|uniref:FAD/NAD(P)-binding domain-containing protein n=1 Tax=Cercophora newfieldiana TaxID=92897 RepID=A0AA39XXQ8_9PEZI|nr:hypothetical protein B0T16DRAFT_421192 [Cercophora newfieldiana]